MNTLLYRFENCQRILWGYKGVLATSLTIKTSSKSDTSLSCRHNNTPAPLLLRTVCTSSRHHSGTRLRLESHINSMPLMCRYKSIVLVSSLNNCALKSQSKIFVLTRNYSARSKILGKKTKSNFYDVLGITPKATQAQVKAAYYKLSKRHHPDIHHSSENQAQLAENKAKFNTIGEAYGVLGNSLLRRRYDRGILSSRDTAESVKKQEGVSRRDSQVYRPATEKKLYDFDEFYNKHYGESISRERRARAQQMEMEAHYAELKQKANNRKNLWFPMTLLLIIGLMFQVYNNYLKDDDWKPTSGRGKDNKQ